MSDLTWRKQHFLITSSSAGDSGQAQVMVSLGCFLGVFLSHMLNCHRNQQSQSSMVSTKQAYCH